MKNVTGAFVSPMRHAQQRVSTWRFALAGATAWFLLITPICRAESDEDFFEARVRPLLVRNCQECHGSKKQWAELRLDSAAGLRKGGESGPVVVAGKPNESELLLRISEEDVDLRMPPKESGPPLTAAQIAVISHWIKTGAAWPKSAEPSSAESLREAQRRHWAFQPIAKPDPPAVFQETAWPRNAIDQFILSRLEAEDLPPSPVVAQSE